MEPRKEMDGLRAQQPQTEPGKETEGLRAQQPQTEPGKETKGLRDQQPQTEPGKETEGLRAQQPQTEPGKETEGLRAQQPQTEPGKETEGLRDQQPQTEPGKETDGRRPAAMETPPPPETEKCQAEGQGPLGPTSLAGIGLDDAICYICKDYLTDPVTIECGHNFCWGCITQRCVGHSCPQCGATFQKRDFKSNTLLGRILESIKQPGLNPGQSRRDGNVCEEHGKELTWFCKEDRKHVLRVTLDEDTANPELLLTGDRQGVRYTHKQQDLSGNPERFDKRPWVLGSQGFTEGTVYWEVEVGDEVFWMVGVAKESVRRKGWIDMSPKEGIWAIHWNRRIPPVPPSSQSTPPQNSKRIRVCLNYEQGQVTFFNADNEALIHTVRGASFDEERIRPFFGTKSHLSLRPCPETEGRTGDTHQ
ncbi:nuclear factor 7, ovary-like [Mauremys reevesii]|uniref:nuclear factor 7, ovary-like n=1 Tax=Mauremys reevesii TaxID=260615 RepID=UPI00193F3E47|nr:nuclear factor 7, ovary-like [Mauremys reevesii]